ncbi:hypothetical protein ACMAZD_22325 [Vibrio sp. nBUS_14]|uniref:hypothetical protein n=1 Tax=Vibrio sp. nBUS_14 TaxID=3395321 RepID=UPI003EC09727
MPLIVVLPLIAGGLGFGAGFWSGSSATKLLKVAAVGGGCYVAYRVIKGGK